MVKSKSYIRTFRTVFSLLNTITAYRRSPSMEIGSLQLLYSFLRKINKGMAINMCIFSKSKPIVLKVFDIHCRGSL